MSTPDRPSRLDPGPSADYTFGPWLEALPRDWYDDDRLLHELLDLAPPIVEAVARGHTP